MSGRVHCACWQTLLVQASFFHPVAPFFSGHDLCTLFVDQLSRDTLGIHGGHPGRPPQGLLHKLTHHAAACLIAIAAFESECGLTRRMRHAARCSKVRKSLVSSLPSGVQASERVTAVSVSGVPCFVQRGTSGRGWVTKLTWSVLVRLQQSR